MLEVIIFLFGAVILLSLSDKVLPMNKKEEEPNKDIKLLTDESKHTEIVSTEENRD